MRASFLSEHWHRVAALKPRLRAHVPVTRHRTRGQAWYIIQDSATGRFHRFTPIVYRVIGSMNGRRTIDEIWRAAIDRLGDEAPSQSEIVDLLVQLHAADLIQTDIDADAAELFARARSQANQQLRSRFANPMAIRLPLVNPNRFLARTAGFVRPFFGPFGLVVWLAAIGYAGILAALNWRPLTENIADHVMGVDNILIMAALFPVLKLAHELGHGYACRLRGGEVREAGIMLLVLAPVPYVDATASTAFRSRGDRILVAAAGMLVETLLAAIAMMVWASVEPGLIRTLAFNTMVIAGISTVLFNINPLMRLDGYFILCDLIDIPNLGQRATRFWADLAERRLLGLQSEAMPTAPGERAWLAAYAPASLVYRLIVMTGIALFVANAFFIVGVIIALASVFSTLVWPLIKIARFVLTAPKLAQRRHFAALVTFGGAAALLAALLFIPMPLRTVSEGVVWLPDSAILRLQEDGFVDKLVTPSGAMIEAGAIVLSASEPDLANEAIVSQSQIDALQLRLASERLADRVQAEVTRTELAFKTETLDQQQARLARLTLLSPESGQLIVPHAPDLPGRFLKRGEVIGFVLPAHSRLIRVAVPQADIDLVRQRLRRIAVMLPGRMDAEYPADLVREVPAASTLLPSRALSIEGGGRIAVDSRDPKSPRALEGLFLFDITVPAEAAASGFGARAYIRFDHGFEPLAFQWWRRLRQLFLSRLAS